MKTEAGVFQGGEMASGGPARSLGEHYTTMLQQHGDKTALVQEVDGNTVSVTYRELLQQGRAVARMLRAHGLGSKDTVMVRCEIRMEYTAIMLGTTFIGATHAPVNTAFETADMLHMLQMIKPQLVILEKASAHSAEEALAQHDEKVIVVPMEAVTALLKRKQDEDFQLGQIEDPHRHVALLMGSSGTTGKSKGVEFSHTSYLNHLTCIEMFPNEEDDDEQKVVAIVAAPHWITHQLTLMRALTRGYKTVLIADFQGDTFLAAIHKYRINLVVLNPPSVVSIAKSSSSAVYDLSCLQGVVMTGAFVTPAVLRKAEDKLTCRVVSWYGLTECSAVHPAYNTRDKPMNVGVLGNSVQLKVLDESGMHLGAGQLGELCFKSPVCFLGYRGNEQATQEVLDEDGYVHSGDLGYCDEDGHVYLIDRIKHTFKFYGIHVAPGEIEELLLQHDDVMEAAVVGLRNNSSGAYATAFIVVRPGTEINVLELTASVNNELPNYKWLRGGVHILESLPKTASGKVKKIELRNKYELLITVFTDEFTVQ